MPNYELPQGYTPFATLNFSSNILENVGVPLMLKERPVLLIGSGGDYPRVWLSVPTPRNEWISLVADNEVQATVVPGASVAPIRVERIPHPVPTVEVFIGNLPLLRARKEDPLFGRLEFIDLRPLGLNIVGTATTSLSIGANTFQGNRVKNADVMIRGG